MPHGRDSMLLDCMGPSSYFKAQGLPVRVWGLLAVGVLNIFILEQGKVMDQWLYIELVEDCFPGWLKHCSYIVQDFERASRTKEVLAALDNIVMLTFQEFLTFGNSEAATKNYVAFDC